MSGMEIASEVAAAIAEAGAEVGSGSPLAGAIIRAVGADETVYPPVAGTDQEFACTVLLSNYTARDRDGTQVTARDVRVTISPDAGTDPRNGDRLRVGGVIYSIEEVMAVQPGGVVLMWKCRARRGD